MFAIIVFGCISSEGWRYDRTKQRETCLYNDDSGACNYGVGIGVIAFLASIGFLAGEYLFEQMSSVKTRKHYVLGDLAFSGNSAYSLIFSDGVVCINVFEDLVLLTWNATISIKNYQKYRRMCA